MEPTIGSFVEKHGLHLGRVIAHVWSSAQIGEHPKAHGFPLVPQTAKHHYKGTQMGCQTGTLHIFGFPFLYYSWYVSKKLHFLQPPIFQMNGTTQPQNLKTVKCSSRRRERANPPAGGFFWARGSSDQTALSRSSGTSWTTTTKGSLAMRSSVLGFSKRSKPCDRPGMFSQKGVWRDAQAQYS